MISDYSIQFEEESMDISSEFSEVTVVSVATNNDHSALINRDIADQHPISAITGLTEKLATQGSTTEYLDEVKLEESDLDEVSNLEIQDLWNRLVL